MTTHRKTAEDYDKELNELKVKKLSLENTIKARAEELFTSNPDVVIGKTISESNASISVTAKEYIGKMQSVGIESVLILMKIIEQDLASKHPHKQTEIEFPKTQHEKIMDIAKGIQALNIPKSKK
jgi:hypothetical protein